MSALGGKQTLPRFALRRYHSGMDDELRKRLLDKLDASPLSLEETRHLERMLLSRLSLSADEAEIMAWDAEGRNPADFERLRSRAWDFPEVNGLDGRKRLFAGFITSDGATDGYGGDYLIDFAISAGISPEDAAAAILTFRPD